MASENNQFVNIEINKKYYSVLFKSLKSAMHFFDGNLSLAFEELFKQIFKIKFAFSSDEKKTIAQLQDKCFPNKSSSYILKSVLDEMNSCEIKKLSGRFIRISITYENENKWDCVFNSNFLILQIAQGNWKTLLKILSVEEEEFYLLRDSLTNIFSNDMQKSNILVPISPITSEEFRFLLCFARQLGVEKNQNYAFTSCFFMDKQSSMIRKIEFPYVSKYKVSPKLTVEEIDKIVSWIGDNKRKYYRNKKILYLPIQENVLALVRRGNVIYKKQNRYFYVKKRKNLEMR